MKKTHLNILSIIAFAAICASSFAANPEIRNYSRKTYKAGAQNWQILQSESGDLLFANSEGVLAFDGAAWTLLRIRNNTDVRSLHYDMQRDRILVGGSDEAGFFEFGKDGYQYISILDGEGLPHLGEIWNILSGDDGSIVLQENQHLRILSPGGNSSHSFGFKIDCSENIGGKIYICVHSDGIYCLEGPAVKKVCDLPKSINVRAMLPDGNRKVMLVTEADGILEFDGSKVSKTSLPRLSDNVFCAAAHGSKIALGTVADGVFVYDLAGGETLHLNRKSGLQRNTVLSLAFDRAGDLWLGLNNGIDQVILSSPVWNMYSDDDGIGAGYASASFKDKLYLGTNQGLFHINKGKLVAEKKIQWQVWSLDVIGDALFCSHDKGLRIIYKDGKVTNIALNGSWKVEPLQGHPGYLLGCTYDKLYVLKKDGKRWKLDGYPEGFHEASKSFVEDSDGRIWFAHWVKGLYRLTFSDDMSRVTDTEQFSEKNGFPTAHNNYPNRWHGGIVFSTEGGYFSYDNTSGRAVPVDELNALFRRTPLVVMLSESASGDMYFSSGDVQGFCHDGVLDTLNFRRLRGRRILGFDCNYFMGDNRLLLNTEDGFAVVRTDGLGKEPRQGFPVHIRDVALASGEIVFGSRKPADGAVIRLEPKQNSLRFEFTCPEFASENAVLYRCRLEGFDREWSPLREESTKDYTGISHGSYTFTVEAFNQNTGEITSDSVVIKISAPWYLSKWMYLLYVVVAVGLIFLFQYLVRVGANRKARQIALRHEQEQEKARMFNDLQRQADDLAASTMNVIRKNQILQSIDTELYKLDDADGASRHAILRKLHHDIGENFQHDDDWQKFSQHFDFVYDDYLKRLGKDFPALSTGDKRLCAYLKMGLSSKEIAPLMNMTIRSVEMSRYRLRKKLNLDQGTNLSDFLQHY